MLTRRKRKQRDRLNEKTDLRIGYNSRFMNPPGPGLTPPGLLKYNKMEIKFKKLSHKAVMPSKAHKTDAGFDI